MGGIYPLATWNRIAVSKVWLWLFVDGSRDWRVLVQEIFTGGASEHPSSTAHRNPTLDPKATNKNEDGSTLTATTEREQREPRSTPSHSGL